MQSTISPASAARGSERHTMFARALRTALLSATVTLAACGGASEPRIVEPKAVDTSTLVGTWVGSLDGGEDPNSYGPSAFSMMLKADSTFTGKAENPNYCDLGNTTWRVSNAVFTASGRDCDGILVTFTAPVSPLRLTGTWTATSGRSGGFTLAKL